MDHQGQSDDPDRGLGAPEPGRTHAGNSFGSDVVGGAASVPAPATAGRAGHEQLTHDAGNHGRAGHDRHAGHSVAMFRDRFWLSLALTLPVLIWNPDLEAWLGYQAPAFAGSQWIPAIVGSVVFVYGGTVFLRGAAGELRDRRPGMMSLISLAILVAFFTSWAGTERGIDVPAATGFEALAGRGARATVEGSVVAVGGPRLLADLGLPDRPEAAGWAGEGRTVLHVVADGRVVWALALEDAIRPESAPAIERLHGMGIRVAMITGDSQAVADSVAARIGIDEVAAQVLPGDKAAAVRRFQAGGRRVAMVGDGVNDAPPLATADVGIAIGAGTDVAMESAGIVLVRSDPRDVAGAIELSRASYAKMLQNLVWATGYNAVAIPIAAGVLVPWGIDLPMAVGAIAMSASTIIVAANAQLLRRLRLRPAEAG